MSSVDLAVRHDHVATADGWLIHLKRTVCPAHYDADSRPLLIVPGYGMNSYIFGYHPRGTSMERCLAEGGFEVWSLDMRGQGAARRVQAEPGPVSLQSYASVDLPAAIEHVAEASGARVAGPVLIGCSLGGSIAYAHLALTPRHRVGGLITMGAPLRWTDVHPLVRAVFSSPRLAGTLRLSGTRRWVQRAVPLLQRTPWLLRPYMNATTIDMRRLPEMTATVEDPQPTVNREIAGWLRARDLTIAGVNITEAMGEVDLPLLVVLSNRDGIVPDSTALSVVDVWGGDDVQTLTVGTDQDWYAHANLFVGQEAPSAVFEPLMRWLRGPRQWA